MIEIDIPGFGILRLEHLVLDYNGTIAVDGQPVQGVKERLIALALIKSLFNKRNKNGRRKSKEASPYRDSCRIGLSLEITSRGPGESALRDGISD